MKVTYNWLKLYVDIDIDPRKLGNDMLDRGIPVEIMTESDDDFIYEIEIPANRSDWLGVIGIAREVAAIYSLELKIPTVKEIIGKSTDLRIELKTSKCPFYTGRVIRNIEIKESPEWMRKLLENVGIRSINNIVDITNFVMMETGNPLHAFDLAEVSDNTIIVKESKKGEEFAALDEKTYKLPEGTILIADTKRNLAMGGIIGGKESEIKNETKDILLESAYFDPITIRKTGRTIGLSTDSSYRFERDVDITSVEYASLRATNFILEYAGGECEEIVKEGSNEYRYRTISLDYDKIKKRLGLDIDNKDIDEILTGLQFEIKNNEIMIPSFRKDISIIEDISEEVARFYGYANIPNNFYQTVSYVKKNELFHFITILKKRLTMYGLHEIIVPTFAHSKYYEKYGYNMSNVFSLMNPITSDNDILRPEAGMSLLKVADLNYRKNNESIALFEVNAVFRKDDEDAYQAAILLWGKTYPYKLWNYTPNKYDFYHLKGILEDIMKYLKIEKYNIEPAEYFLFDKNDSFAVKVNDKIIGYLGKTSKKILKDYDIKGNVWILLLEVKDLLEYSNRINIYEKIPAYPHLKRDLAFVVEETVSAGALIDKIKNISGKLLYNIYIFDVYKGEPLPKGKKNIAFHLDFNGIDKTLSDEEINDIIKEIVQVVEREFGALLRQQ